MAASTYNGHIRVWNVSDGKPLWTATNASRAWSLAFSTDESLLACSHFHGRVSLWDVATGRLIHVFEGHQAWVHAVAFDPGGLWLASAGIDTQVLIWDLKEKKLNQVLRGHKARIWSLAFSSDGKLLASGGDEENVHIWDCSTGNLLHVLPHYAGSLVRLAFHPNGRWIAIGCEDDPRVSVWNAWSGEKLTTITSYSHHPSSLAFDPEGNLLAIGGRDGSVEIWQMAGDHQFQYVKMLIGHHHYISVIAFSQHNLLATLSYGEDIRLWNVESGRLLRVIEGFSRLIGTNAFSPDGRLLLQGDASGKIRIWDMLEHRYITRFQGHTGPIWTIEFCPEGKTFATAGDDRCIKLWDVESLHCIKTFAGHLGQIWCLAYQHDGSLLVSGGSPNGIWVWDPATGTGNYELKHFETPDDIWSLALDPTGEYLASGHSSGAVIVFEIGSGKQRFLLPGGTVPVGALRFSSDGKTLMASSNQFLLKYWDVQTGTCRRTIPADLEGNRTRAVAIGADGKLVATGSGGLNVYLWLTSPSDQQLTPITITGHTNRVWGVALSPDERYIASSDEEGTTLLSDTRNGKVIEKIMIDRPYERMNVRSISGLNAAERAALKALGAVETDPGESQAD
jgi:WD40 repeat protein